MNEQDDESNRENKGNTILNKNIILNKTETNLEKISNEIINEIKDLHELFEIDSPPKDEPYFIIIMECSENFYNTYSKNYNSEIFPSIKNFQKSPNKNKESNQKENFDDDKNKEKFLININKELNGQNGCDITENIENPIQIINKNSFLDNYSENFNEYKIPEEKNLEINIKETEFIPDYNKESLFDIKKRESETRINIKLIQKLFEKLNLSKENLEETLIQKLSEKSTNNLKKNYPEYYAKGIKYFNKMYHYSENYFEINLGDVILLMCCVIKYYTKLNIKLEFSIEKNKLIVIIFGTENIYDYLAEKFNYYLQLKPYALKYRILEQNFYSRMLARNTINLQKNPVTKMFISKSENESQEIINNHNDNEETLLIEKDNLNLINKPKQFEELNENIPVYFPPYLKFIKEKDVKYRRYERDDLYHECQNIPLNKENNCNKCSKFRNIDKLRLINKTLNGLFSIAFLKQHFIYNMSIFQRNINVYEEKISFKNLFKYLWNPFSNIKNKYFINLIRNFFGETVSYFYLWIHQFLRWLIFPSILGILVFLILIILPKYKKVNRIGNSPISYIEIINLIFCTAISFWVKCFLSSWKQKESLYAYFWGTEDFIRNETDKENFKPDYQTEFVFGQKIKFVSNKKRAFKKFISYLFLIFMVLLTCFLSCFLLYWKQSFLNEEKKISLTVIFHKNSNFWHDAFISIIFGLANAIQIKIFDVIYISAAEKLNEWENYQKDYEAYSDLSIKIFIFKFMNTYTSCFYIGFVKPNIGLTCVGTCMKEVELQLYSIYFVNFVMYFFVLLFDHIIYFYRKSKYKKLLKKELMKNNCNFDKNNIDNLLDERTQSPFSLYFLNPTKNLIKYYNEIILLFGFVCLFSVAAPLTPFIIFILVWTFKLTSTYNIYNLKRFESVETTNSIGIYNKLLKTVLFLGMLTNVGIVLFSFPLVLGDDLYYKIVIFLCIENFYLFFAFLLHFNELPQWFKHLEDLKELYIIKYFNRNEENLPHLKFIQGEGSEVCDFNSLDSWSQRNKFIK